MSDDFSWSDAADRDQVILREQPRTAIYLNPFNQIVIRQAADGFEESDPFVFFSVENVARVAREMLALAGVELPVTPPAANSSGAERSRRYRKRHAQRDDRHATVTRDVTDDRNGDGALTLVAAE